MPAIPFAAFYIGQLIIVAGDARLCPMHLSEAQWRGLRAACSKKKQRELGGCCWSHRALLRLAIFTEHVRPCARNHKSVAAVVATCSEFIAVGVILIGAIQSIGSRRTQPDTVLFQRFLSR